jgi:hypothetical protein
MSAQAQLWTWRPTTLSSIAARQKKSVPTATRLTRHYRPAASHSSSASESAPETRRDDKNVVQRKRNATAAATAPARRIARAEALRRMEEVVARSPTLAVFLNALDEVSTLSGLPPARCVWFGRTWGYASRRWALPQLLAALKAVGGAEVADLVRLVGQNGSLTTAVGIYKEAVAAGWCEGDGGAAMTAMAWAHDGVGNAQGKQADALWRQLHELALNGGMDIAAVRKCGGGKNAGKNPLNLLKHLERERKKKQQRRGASEGGVGGESGESEEGVEGVEGVEDVVGAEGVEGAGGKSAAAGVRTHAEGVEGEEEGVSEEGVSAAGIAEMRAEVFALEITSKSRRRHRAAATAYVRFRDGDGDADESSGGGGRLHWSGRRDRTGSSAGPNSRSSSNSSSRSGSISRSRSGSGSSPDSRSRSGSSSGSGSGSRSSSSSRGAPPPVRFTRPIFTAACRAASALRDVRFARRVAVDLAADGVTPDSYMVRPLYKSNSGA